MKCGRAIFVVTLLLALLGLSGCKKKKPVTPAPQAQAPTLPAAPATAQPAPAPPPPSGEPNRPQPAVVEPAPAPAPAPKTTTKTKPKSRKVVTAKKPAPAPPPAPAPEKPTRTVVENGGAAPASRGDQLSATLPRNDVIHQKADTAQLLEATDFNLKSITRALSAEEQNMVQYIRSFMDQSRQATKEGDVERAYKLAMKAHLLSDELVKR